MIESPQKAAISVKGGEVLNFCANNYLGLSNHPRLIEGAKKMMDRRGFGMSSVRFICGTQAVSYTHLRAHETRHDLVCRLLLEKKNAPYYFCLLYTSPSPRD